MIVVVISLCCWAIGVCVGLNIGADTVRKQVMDGKVIVDGRKYFCYPDSLTSKHK